MWNAQFYNNRPSFFKTNLSPTQESRWPELWKIDQDACIFSVKTKFVNLLSLTVPEQGKNGFLEISSNSVSIVQ